MRKRWLALFSGLVMGTLALVGTATAQEVALRAVAAFPKIVPFTASFHKFVDKANEVGKGHYKIEIRGGPEVIPPGEQGNALKTGVVDMIYTPPNFYLGIMPEGDALAGSRRTPMELRANGGTALLEKIYAEKLDAHFLAWGESGVGFYIFLIKEPKFSAAGGLDLRGLRLRSTPIFRDFLNELGANNVMMHIAEVHTALERGTVDGIAAPVLTFVDQGWERFIRHRVEPPFLQADVATIVNLAKWRSMPQAARDILQRVAIEWEKSSYDDFQRVQTELRAAQDKGGIKPVPLSALAATEFQELALKWSWKRINDNAPANYAALREKFYNK